MSLTRDRGKTIHAVQERIFITCSTANQIHGATGNVTSTYINGVTIDRLGEELIGRRWLTAEIAAYMLATRGSTETDRKLILTAKLQHGDSSSAGDMADYSTDQAPASRTFFTSAQTTPMGSWSTGALYGALVSHQYDIRGMKRFVRVVLQPQKNRETTDSSGDESMHVGALIRFGGADELGDKANTTGAGSTSTSTST